MHYDLIKLAREAAIPPRLEHCGRRLDSYPHYYGAQLQAVAGKYDLAGEDLAGMLAKWVYACGHPAVLVLVNPQLEYPVDTKPTVAVVWSEGVIASIQGGKLTTLLEPLKKTDNTIDIQGEIEFLPPDDYNDICLADFANHGPRREILMVSSGLLDEKMGVRTKSDWIKANTSDGDGTHSFEIIERYARGEKRLLKNWTETEERFLRDLAARVGRAHLSNRQVAIWLAGTGGVSLKSNASNSGCSPRPYEVRTVADIFEKLARASRLRCVGYHFDHFYSNVFGPRDVCLWDSTHQADSHLRSG